ncbi:MAG: type 4a pilus biogenesis protein PilO [Desulfobulbaceae bacterium]|nr:type 4a pilus biogenesis protein PilO [Desulfobulbaceae bacterium]
MNRILIMMRQNRRRLLLALVAGVLLFLNFGRSGMNYFSDKDEAIDSRIELLSQHTLSVDKLSALKKRVAQLERQKKQLDQYLFTGESEEQIASQMQILLQENVSKAGLEPESLRPIIQRDRGGDKGYSEVAIKLRLSGSLSAFNTFVADMYRSKRLFKVESFVLKPYRKKGLKILMDLKGYYKLKE